MPRDIFILHMCAITDNHGMVPEKQSATDRIFCHFGPFFFLLTPLNCPKNQNFEKMKKMPGDIIFLMQKQVSTKNSILI